MRLEAITADPPPGALALLCALGQGENGFGGTPVGADVGKLDEWLDYCVHLSTAPALSEDFLPQTNYWIKEDSGYAVGLVRLRTQINADLLNWGGHLGYYIAPAYRNRGYGKAGLRLALRKLRDAGVARALVTVDLGNILSLRVVNAAGGILEDERVAVETGRPYGRFWLPTGDPHSV
jgi:predicted acetyltransferase